MATEVKSLDPRVKRTRQLLQKAFFELMQEKGFHAMTVQDITEKATVNRATFYAHFEDKYALLDSTIREMFQQLLASKLSSSSTLTIENLRILILTVFDYLSQMHNHECKPVDKQIDPLFEEAIQEEIYTVLTGWLRRLAIKNGTNRALLETTATAMSWAIFGTAVRWSQGERAVSKEEMVEQVMMIVVGGLSRASQIRGEFYD